MLLLNGSVEVAGGYVYHSEGVSCDVNMMAVQANISIREGMPIGKVLCKRFYFMMNCTCHSCVVYIVHYTYIEFNTCIINRGGALVYVAKTIVACYVYYSLSTACFMMYRDLAHPFIY